MRYYLLTFFILTCLAPVFAEEKRQTRLGITFGASYYGYREETDIALNRKLATFNFIFDGDVIKNRIRFSFNANIFAGKNKETEVLSEEDHYFSFKQRASTFIKFSLDNSVEYNLWGPEKFPGYLGGGLRADVYYNYLKETIYYSTTALFTLNVRVTQMFIINEKNNLVLSIEIPFFGYGIRPPNFGLQYSHIDLEHKVISFHNHFAFYADLRYQYKFNQLLSLYSILGFEFSHIKFPQLRRDACSRLNIGLSFSF